uniref:RING-type domain-containing protein n=1 Tax=Arcella intermedia TaxID=1963864 RepID=A0A6B2LLZ3_9EUKA
MPPLARLQVRSRRALAPHMEWDIVEDGIAAPAAALGAPGGGVQEAEESKKGLEEADFECALCYRLFYRPVTTPCGHTYCRECILTSLTYQPSCPICRRKLNSNLSDFSINFTLASIIEKHFTTAHNQREQEQVTLTPKIISPPSEEAVASYSCWYWGSLLCDV